MDNIELLRSVAFFEGLTDEQIARVGGLMASVRVPAETAILREGDHSFSLFVLCQGQVEVTKRLGLTPDDAMGMMKDKTIVRLTAPQFFGEMALLGDSLRTATVIAGTDCDLLELSQVDFERLGESDLPLAYRLLHNIASALCSRLRRTDRDVLKLTAALSLALGNR